jgi:DNA-binding beta-propeller fold protein YncE
MTLQYRGAIDLPPGRPGGFDHADVHPPTGAVFVAHTAFDQVEIIDGPGEKHRTSVPGCPEGSGVLYAPDVDWMFAAARGAGRVLVLEAASGRIVKTLHAGFRPNGIAWNPVRRQLLVADVQDFNARLLDSESGALLATTALPGRPRWAAFDQTRERFLVNIADPACVVVLGASSGELIDQIPVASVGPHGMAFDELANQLFIACDSAELVTLRLDTGAELSRTPIAGPPDVLWYNPRRSLLYVAIGKPGTVQVVDTLSMAVTQEVATEDGAHTLTFDVQRQLLYVFLPQSCQAGVFEVH